MEYKQHAKYYANIPANVRYDNNLKPAEKLLYGEITALANKKGYCYAQNKYFSELYEVRLETVSRWISHLQKCNYIKTEIIKDENKKIISRNIYIADNHYIQKNQYDIDKKINTHYVRKNQKGTDKKVKQNNIKYNIDDDIFYYITNNTSKVPKKFFEIIERLEFNYEPYMLQYMKQDKINMIRDIVNVLYDLYKSGFDLVIKKVKRQQLVDLYLLTAEKQPNNLLSYYKKAIINSNRNCQKM